MGSKALKKITCCERDVIFDEILSSDLIIKISFKKRHEHIIRYYNVSSECRTCIRNHLLESIAFLNRSQIRYNQEHGFKVLKFGEWESSEYRLSGCSSLIPVITTCSIGLRIFVRHPAEVYVAHKRG